MKYYLLPSLLAATLAITWLAHADGPVAKTTDAKPDAKSTEAAQTELRSLHVNLLRQYKEFEQQLLIVAQRLEKSPKQEDRAKAVILKDAIRVAGQAGIEVRYTKLIESLKNSGKANSDEVMDAMNEAKALRKSLRE